MSGQRPQPRPPGAGGGERPASGGGQRPARPRSAIRMLPEPGGGGRQMGSSSDLAAQLGLDPGTRSSVAGTQAKMDRAREKMVTAPGSAAMDSDSDSDSSSDGGGAPPPQRAAAARPQRRRLLPQSPGDGLTGGSQFKMMRVPTAIKKQEAPPRTPTGARPRAAVQQSTPTGSRRGSDASRVSSQDDFQATAEGANATDFTAVPIAPASQGQLKGSKGLASPHELADYTKRKVAEIMQRERQTLTRDVGGASLFFGAFVAV